MGFVIMHCLHQDDIFVMIYMLEYMTAMMIKINIIIMKNITNYMKKW